MTSKVDMSRCETVHRGGCQCFAEERALRARLHDAERDRDDARSQAEALAEDVRRLVEERDEARAALAKLEDEHARLLAIATSARIDQTQLRAIADAAAALRRFMRYERTDLVFRPRGSASAVCDAIAACDALDTALAARGEDGGA